MASPLDMKYGQVMEFIRVLMSAGLDSDEVMKVLRSPDAAEWWVKQLKLHTQLFEGPATQLSNARRWWLDRNGAGLIVPTEWSKAKAQLPSLETQTDPLVAWVLTPSFGSVQETFNRLWGQVEETHQSNEWAGLRSDMCNVRLRSDIAFEANTLKWVLVDFNAFRGKSPNTSKTATSLAAQAEILAAACHHPNWARNLGNIVDGVFVPHVNMCGYEATLGDGTSWVGIPELCVILGELRLNVAQAVAHPDWSCPAQVGAK